ncbi:MAG: PP2C family protein-serine/threonine phosphatase [Planctomycetota bacterium]
MAKQPSSRKEVRKASVHTTRATGAHTRPETRKGVCSASSVKNTQSVKRPAGNAATGARGSDTGARTSPQLVSGRIRGMSITWKFSLVIFFMIAFFMLAFAAVIYTQVEKNLDREKKIAGMQFCNALTPLAAVFLPTTGEMPRATIDQVAVAFKELYKIEGIVHVAVTVKKGEKETCLSGPGMDMQSISGRRETLVIDSKQYPDITFCPEGRVAGRNDEVFWFQKSFKYLNDDVSIYLILSRQSIAESQQRLVAQVAGIGAAFVLLGFFVAFIFASVVVKPIKQLVHDMAIVSSGRLDHRTTAHSRDEVGLLANTLNLMTKSLWDARELEKEKLLLDSELTVASDIQARLLPDKTPQIAGYQIVPFYRSAKDVGGDYYDFIPLDRDHMGIVVADVSGKGIIGSLVMSITRTVLRLVSQSQNNFSAADTLSKTNRVIAQDIRRGMFVTAFYLILNARQHEITFSSAGHNPMVIYRSDKRKVELANPKGIALGFNKGPIFDKTIKEEKLTLGSGDMVVLYTDGVVEAMNNQNKEYTEDRFYKFTLEHARESVDEYVNALVADLDSHRGNAPQSDDITIVAIKVE